MNDDKKLKGYYVCACGDESISDFPYNVLTCLICGRTVERKRFITDSEDAEIEMGWQAKLKSEEC